MASGAVGPIVDRLIRAHRQPDSPRDLSEDPVFSGIDLWLALYTETFFQLGVAGARLGDVRCLLSIPGKLGLTAGLFDGESMALLSLRADDDPAMSLADPRRFAISIRSAGPNAEIGRRLASQIHAWDEAGRPGTAGLRVIAYPIAATYDPSPGEFVIEKRWSRLVLAW